MESKTTTNKKKISQIKNDEKTKLQKKFGLTEDKKIFVVGYTQSLTTKNFADSLIKTIEGCLDIGLQVVLLASAEKKYQEPIESLHKKHPNQIAIIDNNEDSEISVYKISDVCLFLNNDDISVQKSLSYGCVPLYLKSQNSSKIIKNFNPLSEEGNGFVIPKSSFWNIFENIVIAKETYNFPYDWECLKEQCIDSVIK